jgi:hypothetical protein
MTKARQQGLLTEKERQFLRDESFDVENPRRIRQRIRERLKIALDDMQILLRHLDDRDVEQLLVDEEDVAALASSFGFMYRIAETTERGFDEVLAEGVRETFHHHQPERTATVVTKVDSESRQTAVSRAKRRMAENRDLSEMEMRALAEDHDENSAIGEYLFRRRLHSEAQLIQYLWEHPELVEEGFEPMERHLQLQGSDVVPDIVGRDAKGRLLIVEVKTRAFEDSEVAPELERYVEEFGGVEKARGVVISAGVGTGKTERMVENFHRYWVEEANDSSE